MRSSGCIPCLFAPDALDSKRISLTGALAVAAYSAGHMAAFALGYVLMIALMGRQVNNSCSTGTLQQRLLAVGFPAC